MGNKGEGGEYDRRFKDAGMAVFKLGEALGGHRDLATDVMGVSIRGPRTEDEDILVTLRGLSDDGSPVVAFFGGSDLAALMVTIENHLRSGSVRWRPDTFKQK